MITLESLLNNEESNINDTISLEDYSFELSNYTMECSDIMCEINTLEAASIVCEDGENKKNIFKRMNERIAAFCEKIADIIRNVIKKISRFIKTTFAKIKGQPIPNWYAVDLLQSLNIQVTAFARICNIRDNIDEISKKFYEMKKTAEIILKEFNEERSKYELPEGSLDWHLVILGFSGFGTDKPTGQLIDWDFSPYVNDKESLKILDIVSDEETFNKLEKLVNEFENLNSTIAKSCREYLKMADDNLGVPPHKDELFQIQTEMYEFMVEITKTYKIWLKINHILSKPVDMDLFVYRVINPTKDDNTEDKVKLFFKYFFDDVFLYPFIYSINDLDENSDSYKKYIAPKIKDISKSEVRFALKALNSSKELVDALGGDENVEIIKKFLSKVR